MMALLCFFLTLVCTKNLVRIDCVIDCVTESPNVNGDDHALLALPDPMYFGICQDRVPL
jgi:hypothetical protein